MILKGIKQDIIQKVIDETYNEMDELIISQQDPDYQALEISDSLFRCDEVDLLVIDSIGVLVAKPKLEATMGHTYIGLQVVLMS